MISDPVRAAHAAAVSHAAYLVVASQHPVARSHQAPAVALPAVACQPPLAPAALQAGVFLHPLLAAAVPSAVVPVAVVPTAAVVPSAAVPVVVVPIVVVPSVAVPVAAVAVTLADADKGFVSLL